MLTPFERVRDALAQGGYQPRQVQGRTMARCPAHDDRNPSLSVREGTEGRVLLRCFAGCETVDVVAALGLSMRDLFSENYRYDDGRTVTRFYDAAGRKQFRQSNTQGTPTLYRLASVRAAVAAGQVVYLAEGEKDVHALEVLGVCATSAPMGATSFHLVDAGPLRGAQVAAVVDRDTQGDGWAAQVADKLAAVGARVRFVQAKTGKDAADHVAAGHGVEDFQPYTPPPAQEAASEAQEAQGDDLHAQLVRDELRKLRAREAAREILAAERRPAAEPFDAGTLAEMLARPPEPLARVEGLLPWHASTQIVAGRKTGKTTFVLNLTRSLITGEPFLGACATRPVQGRVCLLNYEVSGAQVARWADEVGVPDGRLFVVNLRGRRNPLAHPEDRRALAGLLRAQEVETLIVDPFGRAYTGASQNDAGEVGAWLVDLDTFARAEVGALDLILTAHAGWNGERTRGSSALEDWADSIITLTKDENEDRFMRAIGRDVDHDEDRLDYDPHTRRLTLAGTGSRKTAAAHREDAETRDAIVCALERHPDGLSGKEMSDLIGRKDAGYTRARDALVNAGTLRQTKRTGRGGGWLYVLGTQGAEGTETYRTGTFEPTEPPSIGREVQVRDVETRTCRVCGQPLADVDNRGTHPECDPSEAAR